MKINELVDVWDDRDIDNRDGETELRLLSDDKSKWVKLRTFYNWDNPFDEVLYFYFRDVKREKMMAVSFGWDDYAKDNGYVITRKEFSIDFADGHLEYDDRGDDPWQIYEKDLERSDNDSLSAIIANIFKATDLNIDEGALHFVQS